MEDLKILAEQWLIQGIEFVQPNGDICFFAAFPVVLAMIIITLFDFLYPPKKQNIILLSGLSGSGKTVLFNQLRDGSVHQGAVKSVETIPGTIVRFTKITMSGRTKPVHLVDFPEDPRLGSILEGYLHRVAAVVFVVDAVEFLRNCQAASEYLYEILTNAGVVKNRIPVLLCCNKTDRVTAHSKEFIRKEMEKEIEKLRVSRSTRSTANRANGFTLGNEGQAFSFSHCRNTVTVAGSSRLTGETDQVQEFIREHNVKP